MGKLPFAVWPQRRLKIIVRITALVAAAAVADLQIQNILPSAIDQLMRHALRWKTRTHAGAERDFLNLGNQRRLALQNLDKFVLPAVPVQ